MKSQYLIKIRLIQPHLILLFALITSLNNLSAQSFNSSGLSGEVLLDPTSLDFGPDGKLYVSQQDGTIYQYTVIRDGAAPGNGSYSVTNTVTINNIKTGVGNHNDDGTINTINKRQVTGLLAAGTSTNPILYVSSSDSRIGGKAGGEDLNLDTNSGVLSRLSWNGSSWIHVDLVRGLPRCEENHSTNGLDIFQRGGQTYLLLQQGGNTNKGAPSNNFAGTSESYLAGALLLINLTQLEGMTIYTDPRNGSKYIYDLPTLNDPSRTDIDNSDNEFPYPSGHPMYNATIDLGDPFGGNDGLNQSISENGGPVQIFSPGYRNAYDVVVSDAGLIYTIDNGGNSNWGGVPVIYTSGGTIKSNQSNYNPGAGDYITNDFNESGSSTVGDALHYVGTINDANGSYYGGHPVPIRAFPSRAGVRTYENNGSNWVIDSDNDFEDLLIDVSGYFNNSFSIGDFPDDSDQGEFLSGNISSNKVNILDVVGSSTNGICEYTASNFGSAMQGDILAASFNGNINRYELNGAGSGLLSKDNGFLNGFGSVPLDVIAQGDEDPFPGTIWAATYGSDNITVFEPVDFGVCLQPGDSGYDSLADSDSDGYTNGDEVDNGTNHCSGGSQPEDNDGDFVSNLNDPDDDNDGIPDIDDSFAWDPDNGTTTNLPINYPFWNNDPGTGFAGLGFTGWMTNGNTDYIDQYVSNNLSFGGAGGKATIDAVSDGDALGGSNDQDNGFQFGVNVDSNSPPLVVHSEIETPFNGVAPEDGQSYGIFIGTGDQDNYFKVVAMDGVTNGDSTYGFEVVLENGGTVSSNTFDTPGLLSANAIDLYISVDPAGNTAQAYYSFNGGINVFALGNAVSLPASFLNAGDNQGLAVGIISTSNGPGPEYTATWDFINIMVDGPADLALDPDPIDFGTLGINSGTAILNTTATNIGGPASGTLDVTNVAITGPDASLFMSNAVLPIQIGPGAGRTIPISFTPDSNAGNKNASLVITHTGQNSPLIVPLIAVLSDVVVISRVNAAGPTFSATDGNPDWELNNVVGAYTGTTYSVNTGDNIDTADMLFANRDSSIPEYIDQATFDAIFAQERFDTPSGTEMEYTFPVNNGLYTVNLFLGNSFANTSQIGQRVFDIELEGIVLKDDLDLISEFGHQVGGMMAFIVPVSDGELNLRFLREVENPMLNAIEILDASNNQITFDIYPINDQFNNVGQIADLKAVAYGGDLNQNISYSISGQPEGVQINTSNGEIDGAISVNALTGGPNSDGVHQVTVTATKPGSSDVMTQFTWTITDLSSFRINAGGVQVMASDSESDWLENASEGAYSQAGYSVNTGGIFNSNLVYANRHNSIPSYIDQATFDALFAQERFDTQGGVDMVFDIPLLNGNYSVNLYMGNGFSGTSQVGERVFNVLLEGVYVRQNLDLIEEFGHQSGGMLTFPVSIVDGVLNIGFEEIVQSPIISAIEIIVDNSQFPPIIIDPIVDQINNVGDSSNLTINASGGDPQANFTYSLSGQPAGIDVEPTNGQIFGSILESAATGGPNGDGIHQITVLVSKPGSFPAAINFSWIIGSEWTVKNENENYTARHECSFVQAGDKFYLMGGRESARTLDIYDYTTDSWNSLVDSAPVEFNHYQATEYQGLIWVIGAFKTNTFPNEEPADFIWAFDPATQEWIQGPEIPASRKRGSSGLVVYNDKFYIVAGNNDGHDGGYVAWFDEYDPATGIWTPLADAPRARDHFHAMVIGDNLYAVGGRLSGGAEGVFKPVIAEVDVFNFTSGTWSTLPGSGNLPTPRGAPAVANFNGKLVVAGGEVNNELVYGTNTNDALKITEEFDPGTGIWTRLPDLNFERHGTQAIVSGNGLYVVAGSPNLGGGNQKNMEYLGGDNATGVPSVSSTIDAPAIVDVEDGNNRDIILNVIDGNIGIFVRSMVISGPNASDYSIVSGELVNGLIKASDSHTVTVGLSGSGANRTAILTINYGLSSSLTIDLTNNNIAPVVENPGTQNNNEGDIVSLQIVATDGSTDLNYDATNLPTGLSIDQSTGLISGTVAEGVGGDGSFLEENGLVVVEAESGVLVPNWSNTSAGGESGIMAGTNSFSQQNGGTIPYQITISTPGVYRFIWNSLFSGPSSTDENDSWLRFPNDNDVWFFGYRGNPASEAFLINEVQNNETNIVFPGGTSRQTPGTTPVGASTNGFFKIFRSGGTSEVYKWQSSTSDNGTAHDIYIWFVNPGTYTMEVSERSSGHVIDKIAMYKVDGPSYSDAALSAAPESQRSQGSVGAAENSPYDVEILVTDSGILQLDSQIDFIWNIGENGNLPPNAVASATPLIGDAPLLVNFMGSNSTDDNAVVSYFWDFKDGTNSNLADPVHTFNDTGTYLVELTVEDAAGFSDLAVITITVTNPNGNQPPIAIATANVESGEAPLEVVFTGSNSTDDVGISSYFWDFKDGASSIEANIEHTFMVAGTYEVELTVTDGEGLSNTTSITITVTEPGLNEPPVAVATATPLSGVAPLQVMFNGGNSTDDVGVVSYSWDFKDGGISTEANPTYTFTNSGTYDVELTVTDDEGLTDTAILTITISGSNEAPIAIASANRNSGETPLAVIFNGASSSDDVGIIGYAWDFMDGSVSSEINPNHTFTTDGTYNVELTVTDEGGLTDTAIVTIVVGESSNLPPVAILEATPTTGDAPLEVTFVGSNSTDDNGIISYSWDFGDGNTSIETDPFNTFMLPGEYIVVLTVTDADGLINTATTTILVESVAGEMVGIILNNPAYEGIAQIQLINQPSDVEVMVIYLHDSSGRLVGSFNPQDIFTGNSYDVPVETVRTGMYYVGIEMTKGDPLLLKLLVSN